MTQQLLLLKGESGSGKSYFSRAWLAEMHSKNVPAIRVNRDDIRAMTLHKWSPKSEDLTKKIEVSAAEAALRKGYSVIVDDTNLTESHEAMWKQVVDFHNSHANQKVTFTVKRLEATLDECVFRDKTRDPRRCVGRPVIERQFLNSGRAKFNYKPKVLVDVDGTLADHTDMRHVYDEGMVLLDRPYPVIIEWVQNLYQDHEIIIVSGRHDTCGKDTVAWLEKYSVPFDHIFMRRGGDNRPDTIIKKEILDAMLRYFDKSQIAFVIDDRPSVIEMWRGEGLRVFPARGAVEPF